MGSHWVQQASGIITPSGSLSRGVEKSLSGLITPSGSLATDLIPEGSGFTRFANRPAGYTNTREDYPFNDSFPGTLHGNISGGWELSWNSYASTTRATDATAPRSPSFVAQNEYVDGMTPGGGVGNIGKAFSSFNDVYIAFDVWWDESFQLHPISTKLAYLEPGNVILEHIWGNNLIVYRAGAQETPEAQWAPTPFGQWVHIEWLVSTTLDWTSVWVDGELQINHAMNFAGNFSEFNLNSTWGGAGGSKSGSSFRRFDYILIATP